MAMHRASGGGVLLTGGRAFPVLYVLVETRAGRNPLVEGEVFGDPDDLWLAFNLGPGVLKLEDGRPAGIAMLNCRSDGAADIRLTSAMAWT